MKNAMSKSVQMSDGLLDLLLIQAQSGHSINLAEANIVASFEQISMLLTAVKDPGYIIFRQDDFNQEDLTLFKMQSCRWR